MFLQLWVFRVSLYVGLAFWTTKEGENFYGLLNKTYLLVSTCQKCRGTMGAAGQHHVNLKTNQEGTMTTSSLI